MLAVIQDEVFIEELCKEHRNIAQSLLDAIKSLLSKIRTMLAEGDSFTPKQNETLLSKLDILKDAEKLWNDGLMAAVEDRAAVGDVKRTLEVRHSRGNDNSSIKEQLRNNLEKLESVKPIANVKYESVKHLKRSEKAAAIVNEYNKKFKGGIERKGFGFIILTEKEVTGSLKYLYTDAEYAAFKALPQLLKRGEIIAGHENHKGRAIDTVTIAAPVTINGTTGYMAAAIKVGGKNRYHVHRILMPDGSEYVLEHEKTEANTSGMTEVKNNGEGPDITSVSKNDTEPIGAGVPTTSGSKGSAVSSVSNSIPENSENSKKQFSLKEYDESQINNWAGSKKIVIYKDDEQLLKFVNDSLNNKNKGKKIYLGMVPDKLAGYVLQQTGVDISNRNVAVDSSEINKIIKDHGNEETENLRGQRAITPNDFLDIRTIIESPDKVELADGDYFGRPMIKSIKKLNGRTTIVTYDSRKHNDLRVQTMYSGQNKKSLATATPEQADVNTPEATSSTAPDNSIRNNSEKGNSKFSLPDETSVYDYVDKNGTEFVDVPPVRDYERTKQRVKNQTYDELAAQVEKLSRDKWLTHVRVLEKTSIKEAMNDMVRTLMMYSESYTSDGKLRKTNLDLVKVATENDSAFREYKKLRDYLRAFPVST